VTIYSGDEFYDDDVTSGPLDDSHFDDGHFCRDGCPDDFCRAAGECAWREDGPS
jgi:hypothetical protein